MTSTFVNNAQLEQRYKDVIAAHEYWVAASGDDGARMVLDACNALYGQRVRMQHAHAKAGKLLAR